MRKAIIVLSGKKEEKNRFHKFLEENYRDEFWDVNYKNLLRLILKKFFFCPIPKNIFYVFEKYFYYNRMKKDEAGFSKNLIWDMDEEETPMRAVNFYKSSSDCRIEKEFLALLEKYQNENSEIKFNNALRELEQFAEDEFDFSYAHVSTILEDFENSQKQICVVYGCKDEERLKELGAYSVHLASVAENSVIENNANASRYDVIILPDENFENQAKQKLEILLRDTERT
jgi:hypothetical protein